MFRYKTIDVASSATGTNITNALAGIGERKRIIREIRCRNYRLSTATTNVIDEVKVVAYKNQDLVLEARLGSFVSALASATTYLYSEGLFKLDLPLQEGDGFQIGCVIADTADNPEITMVYEDQ